MMDPCPFVRLMVTNLALKIPLASKPSSSHSSIHPTSSLCYCKIKLKKSTPQSASVPIVQIGAQFLDTHTTASTFHLSKDDIDKLVRKFTFAGKLRLKIAVYTGRRDANCGMGSGKLLGKITVPLDLTTALSRPVLFHNGWVVIGEDGKECGGVKFHLTVKAEPDPRFVFQFDGEPECSPQVFQIQGRIRQPVFTCKFSFRATLGDRTQRSRSLQPQQSSVSKRFLRFNSQRDRPSKERKGWSITVHDLSGSPVAVASMVTPFVASPNSDRVSKTNPGSWLILRPGDGTLKPWARIEAWRERGTFDSLGLRFVLVTESPGPNGSAGIVLAESKINFAKGGKFIIDLGSAGSSTPSPRGSADFGNYGLWPHYMYRGFVMSVAVEGEGKCSKPAVEVSVQHVGCTEDAAAFVAVAAAVDLSMDACRLFSQKLRRELTSQQQMFG